MLRALVSKDFAAIRGMELGLELVRVSQAGLSNRLPWDDDSVVVATETLQLKLFGATADVALLGAGKAAFIGVQVLGESRSVRSAGGGSWFLADLDDDSRTWCIGGVAWDTTSSARDYWPVDTSSASLWILVGRRSRLAEALSDPVRKTKLVQFSENHWDVGGDNCHPALASTPLRVDKRQIS